MIISRDLWIEIIEADVPGLFKVESTAIAAQEPAEALSYIHGLIAYHRGAVSDLEQSIRDQSCPQLQLVQRFRLWIRYSEVSRDELNALESERQNAQISPLYRGEAEFVSASAFQRLQEFLLAQKLYRSASAFFAAIGAHRKSVRARLCSLAAYTCAYPNARLFSDYLAIYNDANSLGEFLSCSVALLNISREYQRLGAFRLALDYADRALGFAEQVGSGGREHGLILVHRAHVNFDLCRRKAGERDLLAATAFQNSDVVGASSTLAEMMKVDIKFEDTGFKLPTWAEREAESEPPQVLSVHENQLVELLSHGRKSKLELMDRIYGEELDYFTRENRLKNLLSRTRRRHPHLIAFSNGAYELSEPTKRMIND